MLEVGSRGWLLGLALAQLLLLRIPGAQAAEPVTLTVEGSALAEPSGGGQARDRAIESAIHEAAVEVALRILRVPLPPVEQERLREGLGAEASALVMSYRIEPGGALRPIPEDPEEAEYVIRVTATVDASRVRHQLETLGFLRAAGSRPSVILQVRAARMGSIQGRDVRLEPLERAVREHLVSHGFVVLDPGVLPGSDPEERGAVELARAAGADVGLAVTVRFRETGIGRRMIGVVADVAAVATRAADGYELARVRLDTPAYHSDPEEAAMRALEAVQAPLAQNLRVQLERNWLALAGDRRPVQLVLRGVTGFGQVAAVWELLTEGAGVEGVELRSLAPGQAEFALRESPAPAALHARLTRADLPGFQLVSGVVTADRLEVIVRSTTPPTSSAPTRNR